MRSYTHQSHLKDLSSAGYSVEVCKLYKMTVLMFCHCLTYGTIFTGPVEPKDMFSTTEADDVLPASGTT